MEKKFDDTNRGTLFTNGNKQKETHPDYTGKINVEGIVYYLSGWKKTSKAGNDYWSLSIQKKEEKKFTGGF